MTTTTSAPAPIQTRRMPFEASLQVAGSVKRLWQPPIVSRAR